MRTARLSRPQPLKGANSMKYCKVCEIEWRTRRAKCDQCGTRLQGVEGPEERLVAQAAERAERQGAGEDLRESRAVAPVEAKLRDSLEYLRDILAGRIAFRTAWMADTWWPLTRWRMRIQIGTLRGALAEVEWLLRVAVKPESEADAVTWPPDLYPAIEAHTSPPTGDERSGRRNRELSRPCSVDNSPPP
jgi:hypothetical protein